MWKKRISCVLAMMALCGTMAVSAADYTILERAEKVETTVYGTTQTGSLNDRVNALDKLLNGQSTISGSLQDKTNQLYQDVYGNSGSDLSLVAAVNLMQWKYAGHVTDEPLLSRVDALEEGIDGKVLSGALNGRVQSLRYALLGNKKYVSQAVTIPAGTIVTMQNQAELNSKTAKEGDAVYFNVAEDVKVGDIVAIPKGMEVDGEISKARKSGMFGKDGKIEVTYHTARAADGTPVPLIVGDKTKDEYKRTAGAVGASAAGAIILGPVGLVGGLFVHGNDVDIPAGTDMYAETKEDTEVMGFQQVGTAVDLRTADMAASGVDVTPVPAPAEQAEPAAAEHESGGYYGNVTPVELHDGSTETKESDEVVVTISPSAEQTGEVHE